MRAGRERWGCSALPVSSAPGAAAGGGGEARGHLGGWCRVGMCSPAGTSPRSRCEAATGRVRESRASEGPGSCPSHRASRQAAGSGLRGLVWSSQRVRSVTALSSLGGRHGPAPWRELGRGQRPALVPSSALAFRVRRP